MCPSNIEAKYGNGAVDVRNLVDEIIKRFLTAASKAPVLKAGAA